MTQTTDDSVFLGAARGLASELAEYARPPGSGEDSGKGRDSPDVEAGALLPASSLLTEFDRRVRDPALRTATRSRFVSKHYADAVEAGVKALNECVRARTGSTEDGDPLMTLTFSPNAPLLRINKLTSKSDLSEQRGHMHLCQGVVGAWRNPRAHSIRDDSPTRALMMLETIDDLISITKRATRTRKKKTP